MVSLRDGAVVLTAISAVTGGVALRETQPAEAYRPLQIPGECHFAPDFDDDGLGVGVSTTNFESFRWDHTRQGMSGWNSKVASQFTVVVPGTPQMDVRVTFAWQYGASWYTQTDLQCGVWGSDGYWADPNIKWNLTVNAGGSPSYKYETATAIHELGHAYGLDHVYGAGCNDGAWDVGLMYGGDTKHKVNECGWWYIPAQDDVNGWRNVHPA